jgi:hypothetical protein
VQRSGSASIPRVTALPGAPRPTCQVTGWGEPQRAVLRASRFKGPDQRQNQRSGGNADEAPPPVAATAREKWHRTDRAQHDEPVAEPRSTRSAVNQSLTIDIRAVTRDGVASVTPLS